MVRVLASHQCDWGSNPGPSVISGLSLLLVLILALRVFLRVLWFSSPTKTNISKFKFDQDRGPAWKPAKAEVASSLNIVILLPSGNITSLSSSPSSRFSRSSYMERFNVGLSGFGINLPAFYHEWRSMIGCATHYLFCCR